MPFLELADYDRIISLLFGLVCLGFAYVIPQQIMRRIYVRSSVQCALSIKHPSIARVYARFVVDVQCQKVVLILLLSFAAFHVFRQ